LRLLAHRSVDEIVELIAMGEKATWPKLEQIRVQSKIGRKLDSIVAAIDQDVAQASMKMKKRAS
jgi:NTE family protein